MENNRKMNYICRNSTVMYLILISHFFPAGLYTKWLSRSYSIASRYGHSSLVHTLLLVLARVAKKIRYVLFFHGAGKLLSGSIVCLWFLLQCFYILYLCFHFLFRRRNLSFIFCKLLTTSIDVWDFHHDLC